MILVKALILEQGKVSLQEIPRPRIEGGEVLIRVALAGVCGTDLEMIRGYIPFSGVLGHEFVGTVVEDPRDELTGHRVVADINIGCGDCCWCKKGLKNHCPGRKVLGIVHKAGVFAPFVAVPRNNLHCVPRGISDQEAVFTEPVAAALQITEQVHIPLSSRVAVLGDGRLGLLTALVLAKTGWRPLLLGHHPQKMERAENQGIETMIAEEFKGQVDFVIECTGSSRGLEQALKIIRSRGTIILKSSIAGNTEIKMAELVRREINLVGSRCGPLAPALDLINRRSLGLEELVDEIYPLSLGEEALEQAGQRGILKILIDMRDED